jgi:hypothetical protein
MADRMTAGRYRRVLLTRVSAGVIRAAGIFRRGLFSKTVLHICSKTVRLSKKASKNFYSKESGPAAAGKERRLTGPERLSAKIMGWIGISAFRAARYFP